MTTLRSSLTGAANMPVSPAPAGLLHAPVLPPGCSLSMVEAVKDLAGLAEPWRRLERMTAGHHVFQSFNWTAAWSAVYAQPPLIVTGFRDGELVFVWPLMRVRVGPVRVLRWLSEPHAQYGDILVAAGECPRLWASVTLDHLVRSARSDIIRLRHVRADALIAPFLDAAFRSSNMDDAAPSLDLTAFADEAAYEARYTSTQRKRRKKIRKAIESRFGPLRFTILTDPAARTAAIRRALAEKARWVDERGRHNRILTCPGLAGFLDRMSGSAAPQLVVSELSAGGTPLSWEIGLRQGGTHFCFITSHVNALSDLSPARLHMDLSQRQALRDGLSGFDLMVPDDPYKNSWCSARTPTRDYHFPVTALGKLYGTGYLENLRPVLRGAYHAAPPKLLRLLKPILRH